MSFKRLVRGDLGFLVELIEGGLNRSRDRVEGAGLSPERRHDVVVLTGLCALMLGTKLLKVLPGVPFAPGYKIAFLIPLYILAARLTHTPLGATIAGTVMGAASFAMGDGRFGIFEILKHIAPGLVVDAARPFLPRAPGRLTTLFYVVLGAVAAFARMSTMLAVVWFIEGGGALYMLAGLQGVSQVFFGGLSGFVTAAVLSSSERLRLAAQSESRVEGARG